MGLHQAPQERKSFAPLVLGGMGVDGPGPQDPSRRIDHRDLASRAESRVQPQDGAAGKRRPAQQAAEVLRKNRDRVILGVLGQLPAHVALDRGKKEAPGGVLPRLEDLGGPG